MRRTFLPAALLAAFAFALTMPATAQTPTASAALQRLLADEWDRNQREYPEGATANGDHRFDDRWTDLSRAAIAAREAAERRALEAARRIDRAALAADERLDLDVFVWQTELAVARQPFREWLEPINHQWGVQNADSITQVARLRDGADFRNYVRRLQALPQHIDQVIALLREGIAAGQVPPRVLMARVPAQLRAQTVDDPAKSPFWRPFARWPDSVPAAERAAHEADAAAAIRQQVVPAYRRLLQVFESEYLPKAPADVAASSRPGGRAWYDLLARSYTTTELGADEIHAIGLAEVARLRAAMERLKDETGFRGPLADFFSFLRTDPRFFEKTPEALLARYRALAKRIDPELVKVFRHLPRLPYGVRPIPDNFAPDATTAYYQLGAPDGSRPGYYYVNLYKPESRPTWEMVPLTLHEAVPGHHLQFARALELKDLPRFRRDAWYTAYIEGWALYAETLGGELGLYKDPYSRFGHLQMQAFRAARLVVDTGIHALGWSREQAIDWMTERTGFARAYVEAQVDRYYVWPGQATSYMIGELKFIELRDRARAALGDRFDIRRFHMAVLDTGPVPLSVLERQIDDWIAAEKARPR